MRLVGYLKRKQLHKLLISKICAVRFEVLTVMYLRIQVFWDVKLCRWVWDSRLLEGA